METKDILTDPANKTTPIRSNRPSARLALDRDFFSTRPLLTVGNLKAHNITFAKGINFRQKISVMNEYVGMIGTIDKAIALFLIEPLNSSFDHQNSLLVREFGISCSGVDQGTSNTQVVIKPYYLSSSSAGESLSLINRPILNLTVRFAGTGTRSRVLGF